MWKYAIKTYYFCDFGCIMCKYYKSKTERLKSKRLYYVRAFKKKKKKKKNRLFYYRNRLFIYIKYDMTCLHFLMGFSTNFCFRTFCVQPRRQTIVGHRKRFRLFHRWLGRSVARRFHTVQSPGRHCHCRQFRIDYR